MQHTLYIHLLNGQFLGVYPSEEASNDGLMQFDPVVRKAVTVGATEVMLPDPVAAPCLPKGIDGQTLIPVHKSQSIYVVESQHDNPLPSGSYFTSFDTADLLHQQFEIDVEVSPCSDEGYDEDRFCVCRYDRVGVVEPK